MKKYFINEHLAVTINEKGSMSNNDVACALAILVGLKHDVEASQGAANIFVGEDGTSYWVPKPVAAGEEADFSAYANMMQLAPHSNPAICHAIVRKLGLFITPVILDGGLLAGLWRVEYVAQYGTTNFKEHGWVAGAMEPVQETAPVLLDAIIRTALRVMGINRRAFIHHGADDKNTLIHISDWVHSWVLQNTNEGDRLTPVPALDSYAVCGIDEDKANEIMETAIAEAKAQAAEPTKSDTAPAPVETEVATAAAE